MRYAIPVLAAFFLLAFGLGFLATRPLTSAKARSPHATTSTGHAEADDGWRRTADGWERVSSWQSPALMASSFFTGIQRIHPLVGAALLLLLSIGALIASDRTQQDKRTDARIARFTCPTR